MTDEQFNALAPFEELFDRALKNQTRFNDYPGRAAMATMLAIIKSARPNYRTNLNCRTCVLHTIQDAGRMYLGEKTLREKAAETPKRTRKKKTEE